MGLDAVTIIWIARQVRNPHRAALDWLISVTEEEISFFRIGVELWQIGSSPVAPKFNLTSKPNDWSKPSRAPPAETESLRKPKSSSTQL